MCWYSQAESNCPQSVITEVYPVELGVSWLEFRSKMVFVAELNKTSFELVFCKFTQFIIVHEWTGADKLLSSCVELVGCKSTIVSTKVEHPKFIYGIDRIVIHSKIDVIIEWTNRCAKWLQPLNVRAIRKAITEISCEHPNGLKRTQLFHILKVKHNLLGTHGMTRTYCQPIGHEY